MCSSFQHINSLEGLNVSRPRKNEDPGFLYNQTATRHNFDFRKGLIMNLLTILLSILFVLNIFFAVIVIFLERRDASATWAWILVLFFVPLLGFILYLVFGQNLSRKRLFEWDDIHKIGIDHIISQQIDALKYRYFSFVDQNVENYRSLIYMHLINNEAILTQDNNVEIFTDGHDKFNQLFNDIEQAKSHVHLQYYIFRNDQLGKRFIQLLAKKAREGVKIRVLYDDMGSRRLTKKAFKELCEAGGEVAAFFPSPVPLVNLRLNYRNHRKLAIIDGKVGYVGGFNVGDEYLGLNSKFGYWRDTHLRIEGMAVHTMQTRFILDWNQAAAEQKIMYAEHYFPETEPAGNVSMQIVTSGPDEEWEQIKHGYIKMILSAKKSIYIQTPYFIPDASVLDALRVASLSGIDVKIMIPNKPDHMFVYWATHSYVGELLKTGASIYIYENGFIHSKMIVVDQKVASVGTANIDVRSFKLNFEINAFIYNDKTAKELTEIFHRDIEKSSELTLKKYRERPLKIRFKESVSRLLSPIL